MNPLVSILIVSYNCKDLVVDAIQSIKKYILQGAFEIIVVDNASKDDTVQKLSTDFPEVKLIANKQNVGFSAANNQACALSKGEFVLLLNPDAKLINSKIELALEYLNKYPNTIVGPKILNPDFSEQESILVIPNCFDILMESLFLSYIYKSSAKNRLNSDKFALSGACLILKRELYLELKGLDENLFWMEDVDLCFRARNSGISIKYLSEWSIVHLIGQSSKKNYAISISNQLISKLKFFKKNNQHVNFIVSALFTEVHIMLRCILFLILTPFKSLYKEKFKAYSYSQYLFFNYIFTNQKQTF